MAINSNLSFAKDFIKPVVLDCTEVYQKTWSAENRVHYSSRLEQLINDEVALKDFIMTVKPSFVRDFSSEEKLFIYEVLRLAAVESPQLMYLIDDLQNLLKKRGYQHERYLYLTSLTDNQFSYEMDCKLDYSNPSRRRYYRMLNTKFGKKQLTLKEILEQYFFYDFIELNRPRAKKKVRHKGYRDHGSLGSEFSKTLKQQSCDWSLRKLEEERNKKKIDFLSFLSGFGGWE